MIDKQAIEAMEQMLSSIKKYATNAYPEVQTNVSEVSRQRAWIITRLLSRIAEHAADSDFQALLADNVALTYSEREKCANASKHSDSEFMWALHEFNEKSAAFENSPFQDEERTDGDVIRCIENLRPQRELLRGYLAEFPECLEVKLSKKAAKEQKEQFLAMEHKLRDVEEKLAASEALATSRGIAVSLNRYRTVVKKVGKSAKKGSSRNQAFVEHESKLTPVPR